MWALLARHFGPQFFFYAIQIKIEWPELAILAGSKRQKVVQQLIV